MLIFYSLFLWVGFISLVAFNFKNQKTRNIIVVLLGAMAIVLIQGLRDPIIGTDILGYLNGYHLSSGVNVLNGETLFNYEPGYIIFNKLLYSLGVNEQLFLFIVAIVIMIPIAIVFIKYSKMPGLSLMIYLTFGIFIFSFSGLRQAIAVAIVFLSFIFITQKKPYVFISTVLLATTFHGTAIIFLIAYPLYYLKIDIKKQILIVLPSLILFFIFKSQIYLLIYRIYQDGAMGNIIKTGAYSMLFLLILIYILVNIFGSNKDNYFNAYKNYLLVSIFIQMLASQSTNISRINFYFSIFLTLLIPTVISSQKKISMRFLASSLLIAFLLYFFYDSNASGYLRVIPYQFFWQ